jgi:hypothetical protein
MNLSSSSAKESQRKRFAALVTVLEKYFKRWMLLPGSNEVTSGQMAVYAEALMDLPLEAVAFGCAVATQKAKKFPWPGDIREGARGCWADDRSGFLSARGLELGVGCEACGGTGWRVVPVPRTDNPWASWAVACDCRKKE